MLLECNISDYKPSEYARMILSTEENFLDYKIIFSKRQLDIKSLQAQNVDLHSKGKLLFI